MTRLTGERLKLVLLGHRAADRDVSIAEDPLEEAQSAMRVEVGCEDKQAQSVAPRRFPLRSVQTLTDERQLTEHGVANGVQGVVLKQDLEIATGQKVVQVSQLTLEHFQHSLGFRCVCVHSAARKDDGLR